MHLIEKNNKYLENKTVIETVLLININNYESQDNKLQ